MDREKLEQIVARQACCEPFGASVTLSAGERDELVMLARLAFDQLDAVDEGDPQDWANTSPAIAWHLIYRHGENWVHTGVLMERWTSAWVIANPEEEQV